MDRNERETLDFMNVESFSQLPFIRPPPPPREKGGATTAIRLFGKEFGTNDDYSSDDNHGEGEAVSVTKELINENRETSNRKFECHYCCRNFPTSQALGGHQNAHKRERQNAKRAHLQSVLVHGGSGGLSSFDGMMSYNRLGSSSASAVPPPFHSWNGGGGPSGGSYYSATTRSSYGNHSAYNVHHHPQPINGSPLGLWRIPAVQAPLSPLPPFRQIPMLNNPKNEQLKPFSSSSQSRFAFESKPNCYCDNDNTSQLSSGPPIKFPL